MFGLFKKKYNPLADEKLYYNELPSSVKTQLSVLKSLDKYTQHHIEDVPKQVLKICQQLHLNYEKTKFLMIAAYLHDVGKMFIPPAILQKPDKLTDEEYEIMKTHSVKSYDVCMSFEELVQYAKVVRGHHESLDGSGYPDRLVERQINYETRILKVADVYSALKSKRQYKEAWTTKQIFEIMFKDVQSNKMDGEIVYALLLAIIDEKKNELKNIKYSLSGYLQQLEYNEAIMECIEKYLTAKMNPVDILSDITLNKYLRKLTDFDINKVSDISKLLVYINNNIMVLTREINKKDETERDIKELTEFAVKVMEEMG